MREDKETREAEVVLTEAVVKVLHQPPWYALVYRTTQIMTHWGELSQIVSAHESSLIGTQAIQGGKNLYLPLVFVLSFSILALFTEWYSEGKLSNRDHALLIEC